MAVETMNQADPGLSPLTVVNRLVRAVGIAFELKKLILAGVGLAVLAGGWSLLDLAFEGSTEVTPEVMGDPGDLDPTVYPGDLQERILRDLGRPIRLFFAPASVLVGGSRPSLRMLHAGLGLIWAVAVWALFGGAIARVALVEVASIERVGLLSALKFAAKRYPALLITPLCPLLGVALLCLPGIAVGLLAWIPGGVGAAIAQALFALPLLAALGMTLILIGLALGWPLMHLTVVAEGEDLFDALSRSYSYVNQRMGLYLGCLAAAALLGAVGQGLAIVLGYGVVALAGWSSTLSHPVFPLPPSNPWLAVVGYLVRGWAFSYLWSAAAVIYLILRRDVDGTPWHAIYFEAHDADVFAPEPTHEPKSEPSLEQAGTGQG